VIRRPWLVFASERVREEWHSGKLPPIVVRVVEEISDTRWKELDVTTVITSIWRSRAEEKAAGAKHLVHFDYRGVDLAADPFSRPSEDRIRDSINLRFPTGIATMPRVAPLDHKGKLHYHAQATKAEAKRKEGQK